MKQVFFVPHGLVLNGLMLNGLIRNVLWVFIISFVAACAYSPHMLTLQPKIDVARHEGIGQGRVISLAVIDRRADKSLGTQGGVYSESSSITLAPNVMQNLSGSIADALTQMGYVVESNVAEAIQLNVYLNELIYTSPDVLYSNKVDMKTTIAVDSKKENQTFSTSYRSKGDKRFATHPSMKTNEQEVNQLVSQTLQRMFDDLNFLKFISF